MLILHNIGIHKLLTPWLCYLDGTLLSPFIPEYRDKMILIYATTAREAKNIIENQKIPKENRNDMAGNGIYMWENIPDARRHSRTGTETFLVAGVFFTHVYTDSSQPFPDRRNYRSHDSFRGDFQGTRYYMVKKNKYITGIHFIGGINP